MVEPWFESTQESNHHVRVLAVLPRVGLDASLACYWFYCMVSLGDAEVDAEPVEEGLE